VKVGYHLLIVYQEYLLALLWGLITISKGKEAFFMIEEDDDISITRFNVSQNSPTKNPKEVQVNIKCPESCSFRLKLLLDCVASQDAIVEEYSSAILAAAILEETIAYFFLQEMGYNRALGLLSLRKKSVHQTTRIVALDQRVSTRDTYGATAMYKILNLSHDTRATIQHVRLVANCLKSVVKSEHIPATNISKFDVSSILTRLHCVINPFHFSSAPNEGKFSIATSYSRR